MAPTPRTRKLTGPTTLTGSVCLKGKFSETERCLFCDTHVLFTIMLFIDLDEQVNFLNTCCHPITLQYHSCVLLKHRVFAILILIIIQLCNCVNERHICTCTQNDMYFITNYQHLWMLVLIEIAFLSGKIYIYFLILYIFHVLILH